MKKSPPPAVAQPLVFPRADPAELARFDISTKVCTMNCGPHAQDPRTAKERRFLCDDCLTREAPPTGVHMEIRQLPEQAERVETGPVQFGEDWPGVFIRGDNAAFFAFTLRAFLEGGYNLDSNVIARMQLVGLQQLLAGAVVGPAAGMVGFPGAPDE